jgi:Mg-chelatase subunit ChlD
MTIKHLGAVFIALLLVPAVLPAQRTARRVYIAATDASGAPVLNLTAADVQVTENGKPREVVRIARGTSPLRIVLLVDSSTSIGPMINSLRAALNDFVDAVPIEHEIAFISTGGQIAVRTPPTRDRQKLKAEVARFASGGGANAFLDTMIEADKRFLKSAPGQWPTLVIVTTDNGETRREMPLDQYNKFMNDFVARGGAAHAVIVRGQQVGPVTDLTLNLVENVGGLVNSINTDTTLPERLKAIAERLVADHQKMANKYEVDYTGDGQMVQPMVNVIVTRDGVELQMSARRPF